MSGSLKEKHPSCSQNLSRCYWLLLILMMRPEEGDFNHRRRRGGFWARLRQNCGGVNLWHQVPLMGVNITWMKYERFIHVIRHNVNPLGFSLKTYQKRHRQPHPTEHHLKNSSTYHEFFYHG